MVKFHEWCIPLIVLQVLDNGEEKKREGVGFLVTSGVIKMPHCEQNIFFLKIVLKGQKPKNWKLLFPLIHKWKAKSNSSIYFFFHSNVRFHSVNGTYTSYLSILICTRQPFFKMITVNCLSVMRINIYGDYFANKC